MALSSNIMPFDLYSNKKDTRIFKGGKLKYLKFKLVESLLN
jgi:hypothetical protein